MKQEQTETTPWIDCNDRLPDTDKDTGESDYVLVYLGYNCIPQVGRYSNGMYAFKGWHSVEIGRKLTHVIAWMPFPPIPEWLKVYDTTPPKKRRAAFHKAARSSANKK